MGEITDLVEGWRYRGYLEATRDARLARWILSAWVKKAPPVTDFIGVWEQGEVMTKKEQFQRIKKRIMQRKSQA